ncbi:SlyX family protein [Luteimonas sp. FXH3W]|uniref:SlyX family protein n=1 Tax=Aquilutibacter rugosus TaxID=3115820 RepID=A0ABU7V179_9GAMM
MSDDLIRRLADLESRIAFQEHHLEELSDALADARATEARNALLLHRLTEDLRQLRLTLASAPVTGDGGAEPPPPHY